MKVEIQKIQFERAPEFAAMLALVMRPEDLAECQLAGYETGFDAVLSGIQGSTDSWAVWFGGQLGCVIGVDAHFDGYPGALIWALTGRVVDRAPVAFVRTSKAIVASLLDHHRFLWNLVDPAYTKALRWLELLGFTLGEQIPFPGTGAPFVLVTIGGA